MPEDRLQFGAHYGPDGNSWVGGPIGPDSTGVEFTRLPDGSLKIETGWYHEWNDYTLTPQEVERLREFLKPPLVDGAFDGGAFRRD